jgi:hypothetical protein
MRGGIYTGSMDDARRFAANNLNDPNFKPPRPQKPIKRWTDQQVADFVDNFVALKVGKDAITQDELSSKDERLTWLEESDGYAFDISSLRGLTSYNSVNPISRRPIPDHVTRYIERLPVPAPSPGSVNSPSAIFRSWLDRMNLSDQLYNDLFSLNSGSINVLPKFNALIQHIRSTAPDTGMSQIQTKQFVEGSPVEKANSLALWIQGFPNRAGLEAIYEQIAERESNPEYNEIIFDSDDEPSEESDDYEPSEDESGFWWSGFDWPGLDWQTINEYPINFFFNEDAGGQTALTSAAERGNIQVIMSLIRYGVKNNYDLNRALRVAAYWGKTDVVGFLIDNGANDINGALIEAVQSGKVESVRQLMDFEPDNIDMAISKALREIERSVTLSNYQNPSVLENRRRILEILQAYRQ